MSAPQVLMIGAGMIAQDQLLPALYQLQRKGRIGDITVCAQRDNSLNDLASSPLILRAFPGHSFKAIPGGRFEEAIAQLPPHQIVVAAVPDQIHFAVTMAALRNNQHVCCVKPLVLTVKESHIIEQEARARGLAVGVEYHKRLDDRSLLARRRYKEGLFGALKLGAATLMEKWYYRHSNFQNWCTTENSDAFTYIGCHYVDLVHFITGLLPTSVSVYGIKDHYPNGNEGFLWSDARVIWENGAALNVQNSLGFPDAAPGTNTQGMTLYFSAGDTGAWLQHDDQYRGMRYSYLRNPGGPGATQFAEPSPDYMQYVDLGGPGLTPVGYGIRSVEFILEQFLRVQGPLEERQRILAEIDKAGVMATPANSRYNEYVTEAGRLSILNGGREVSIDYAADKVQFKY